MRNYIILNNQRSDEISGLIIQELAPISKPLQRTQVETIDGRDGDIITPLGYAAYNKKIKIGLYGTFDINEIIAYFATEGQVIFSNEPDKYYNYQIVDQIDYERLVRYKVATVTMHVQPFKYSATEGTLTIDASDTVSGEGSEIALDNTAEAPFNILRHKGNATQTTLSGKNKIVCPVSSRTNSDVLWTITADTITASGLASSNWTTPFDYLPLSAPLEPGTYTFSIPNALEKVIQINLKTSGGTVSDFSIQPGNKSVSFNYDDTAVYWRIAYRAENGATVNISMPNKLQLEAGSTATDFEPYVGGTASPNPDYPQDIQVVTGDSTITIDDGGDNSQTYVIPFGDTYLAAIGDYADEPVNVDGTWYIRRAIGKVVLNGSEGYGLVSNSQSVFYIDNKVQDFARSDNTPMSDYFSGADNVYGNSGARTLSDNTMAFITEATPNRLYIRASQFANVVADFKTWLSTHNTTVYYALATPTDEAITDQDLIDALDELYDQAHSYKGRTHLTATPQGDNAPAVLAVEVGEDNESTVTNAGNTTSRPILTIYGQGDIGVYINDVEVLDIELGDEGYITLDSVEMEAYKDNTANLKNRLVTGDYSKLALNAGANKIRFTGTVTKYEISKYSRWL